MKMRRFLFAAGIVAVLLLLAPGWILGEQAVFTYHDQLDGELIAYVLQAKHLGAGETIPEFMNGASGTALTPPAPACVLLFRVCSPLAVLFIMQFAGSLVGYIGMFLLADEVTGSAPASLIAGVLYAFLPFLPVYGLSQLGLPLLVWFALGVQRGRRGLPALVYGIFYALNSSLVLVGFAVLLVLGVWCLLPKAVYLSYTAGMEDAENGGRQAGHKGAAAMAAAIAETNAAQNAVADAADSASTRRNRLNMLGLWAGLLLTYIITNVSLIGQILGVNGGSVSHKTEYVLTGEGFLAGWWNAFLHNGQHSEDYHIWFIGLVILAVCVGFLCARFSSGDTRLLKVMGIGLGCIVSLTGLSAAWNSSVGVMLRGRLGALGAFQLDRLLWLCPCVWYLLLACCVAWVLELVGTPKRTVRLAGGIGCVLLAAAMGVTGLQIMKNSDVKSNLQRLRSAEYPAMSYSDYYAIGVLEQVREYLRAEEGLTQEEYRVVSLGIDPAAALYHGFYCLDGYSNNYSLDYKHSFRRVIAPALDKSDYLREYYDNWGNRCYLFGTESPGYYTIEKGGFYFQHLEIDVEALRELGGDYLFSAAYIANSEELGLVLMREEPFETEGSYYRIYLYAV